ncbi:AAA family ATPase [Streptococcus suis]|uniref:p-loop NTPase n=1 Tax=Streptococcus suis TaxID=1307 RepID=A0A0Z8D005_STRSU|nr:ATP-binding protein [Streptococcus suis]MBL6438941.1 AAA family ATPase [Streptococcus suis]NQH30569.1 AAA family ATPase [Streptococcus suis]NQH47894.1 AAA family ATPase [Streptococcus suis]NQH68601.1 AAA family ATPase [Streptococcus suis]NQI06533.1 AAA family ATPase [Streptococcus suis]
MYISKIKLTNFKSFKGHHDIEFSKGVNFFVGNNNCGKTTIFKAVEFIQSGKNKLDFITKGSESEDVAVEVEFKGADLNDIIHDEKLNLNKYSEYVIDNGDGTYSLRVLRTSQKCDVIQGKKTVSLDLSKVRIYNPNSIEKEELKKFENPTGIANTISALFDSQFVYSDIKNEDYQDFGKTKIIGKIINDITKNFQEGNIWKEFRDAHKKTFGDEGMGRLLEGLATKISSVLKEQYGDGEVQFNFGLPEIDNFFKTGSLLLSDNGISTPVSEKGTGMQRALALSLIQVYAGILENEEGILSKPIMFFIDEPETFLHPKAQDKLIDSLNKISEKYQVFITTHSPYLLKKFDTRTQQINIFSKKDDGVSSVSDKRELNLFGSSSPTIGEINYTAFGVNSVEFHNELYGFIQAKAIDEDEQNYFENEFDKWLVTKGILQDKNYNRLNKNGSIISQPKTLPTLIRNVIHHPENQHNSYTIQELNQSTELLLDVLKNLI